MVSGPICAAPACCHRSRASPKLLLSKSISTPPVGLCGCIVTEIIPKSLVATTLPMALLSPGSSGDSSCHNRHNNWCLGFINKGLPEESITPYPSKRGIVSGDGRFLLSMLARPPIGCFISPLKKIVKRYYFMRKSSHLNLSAIL